MINKYLDKHKEMNENINKMHKILYSKDENIHSEDKLLQNNIKKNNSINMKNNNNIFNINHIIDDNSTNKSTNKDNSDKKNKPQKKDKINYNNFNNFLNTNSNPIFYFNKVESNLSENYNGSNILKNIEYNSNKEKTKFNKIQNNEYNNYNNNEGRKDNYKKNIFQKKNNYLNFNEIMKSNKNITIDNQEENVQEDLREDPYDTCTYINIPKYSFNHSNNYFNELNKQQNVNNKNSLKRVLSNYGTKTKYNFIKRENPILLQYKDIHRHMNKYMNEDMDKDKDKNSANVTYEYVPEANNKNKEKEKEKYIKKEPRRSYTILKKIFFYDYNQKFPSNKKMNDKQKQIIIEELKKEKSENDTILNDYCINYIEVMVLPLFKRKDLSYDQRDVLKYNIETILECCGERKNLYRYYYYPEIIIKKKEIDRRKSLEVLRDFRKEYGLKKEDYCDEGLINRLVENDYNKSKSFQKIFA